MTKLSQVPATANPTHLLLIGDSKAGKSFYVAQAAMDGYTVIYVDSDNGISAVRALIPDGHPALDRILYFRTDKSWKFVNDLLTLKIFRWNLTQDEAFSSATAALDDDIVEFKPGRIPKGILLVIDSWTSVAFDAMGVGAKERNKTLLTMKDDSQGVYGEASLRLDLLCAILQHCSFHVAVLAHPTVYEILKKPKGRLGDVKQKDMILERSVEIPISSTRPHGWKMGKYFTDVGWIYVDTMRKRILDFTAQPDKVSGGTIAKAGTVEDMAFSKIFGPVTQVEIEDTWVKYMTTEEFKEAQSSANPKGAAAGAASAGALKSTPANATVTSMMNQRK